MQYINLKDLYYWYEEDTWEWVPDEVAAFIDKDEKEQKNRARKDRRYLSTVSVDNPNVAGSAFFGVSLSAEEEYEQMEKKRLILAAFSCVPEVQANRIIAHFLQNKSYREIARQEGVNKQTVYIGVKSGMERMRKFLISAGIDTDKTPFFDLYNEGTFSSLDEP